MGFDEHAKVLPDSSGEAAEPSTPAEAPGEEELVAGATRAVQQSIEALHDRGISTTHIVDGRMFRIHPDGRREDLGPCT